MSLSVDSGSHLQPGQMIYLDHGGDRLYAEVIQIVTPRQLCWARPLVLVHTPPSPFNSHSEEQPEEQLDLTDLRQGSDLLLPLGLFQPALDTDVMPILAYLYAPKSLHNEDTALSSQQGQHGAPTQLQQFIRQVWQAHPDWFQPQQTGHQTQEDSPRG